MCLILQTRKAKQQIPQRCSDAHRLSLSLQLLKAPSRSLALYQSKKRPRTTNAKRVSSLTQPKTKLQAKKTISPSTSTRPSSASAASSHQSLQSNALLARTSHAQHAAESRRSAFHAAQSASAQSKTRYSSQSWTSLFSSAISALQMIH